MATGKIENPYPFLVEDKENDNVTIAAGSYVVQEITVTKTGYTPIGTVGFWVATASSSGTGATNCFVRTANLINTTTAQVSVRNNGSSAAKVRIGVKVLYVRNP